MDRRAFIDAMTISVLPAPLVAIAQEPATVRRIGILTNEATQPTEWLAAECRDSWFHKSR